MIRLIAGQSGPILEAVKGLMGVTAALVDPAGVPVWTNGGEREVLPIVPDGPPCLALAARHGRVANARLRGHSCCRSCPAQDCRLVVVVSVSGSEMAGPPAGAITLAWDGAGDPGAERADALLSLAGGLAAAVSAQLAAEACRQDADRHLGRFEALANSLGEPVLVINIEGRVVQANGAAEAVFGPAAGRLMDRPVKELLEGLDPVWSAPQARQLRARMVSDGLEVQASVIPLAYASQLEGALLILKPQIRALESSVQAPRPCLYTFADIKGVSQAIVEVRGMAGRAAMTDATILVRGESGTGKEVFAQAIHSASRRRHRPFVAVNCAAIPDTLLESELFGYDEGAFTGARKGGKPGKFELAEGGTLFLDEVGDMPLVLQAKLLRILQERVVERIGSSKVRPVNVRIIAATNRDLAGLIRSGQFREDLYYRINVIPLEIPPLRQRPEDLYLLIDHFLKKYGWLLGKERLRLSADVMGVLHAYPWPGNVRELENTIQYVVSLEQGVLVTMDSLPPHLRQWQPVPDSGAAPQSRSVDARSLGAGRTPVTGEAAPQRYPPVRRTSRAGGLRVDLARVRELLSSHGNTTEGKRAAARALGISLATLYRWLQRMENENSRAAE